MLFFINLFCAYVPGHVKVTGDRNEQERNLSVPSKSLQSVGYVSWRQGTFSSPAKPAACFSPPRFWPRCSDGPGRTEAPVQHCNQALTFLCCRAAWDFDPECRPGFLSCPFNTFLSEPVRQHKKAEGRPAIRTPLKTWCERKRSGLALQKPKNETVYAY